MRPWSASNSPPAAAPSRFSAPTFCGRTSCAEARLTGPAKLRKARSMALADILKTKPKPEQNPGPTALSGLLGLGRPVVMGILNVTPDSFSDGGKFLDPATAIAHAKAMAEQGADLLDIGAESTRPYGGMQPVTADDEEAR